MSREKRFCAAPLFCQCASVRVKSTVCAFIEILPGKEGLLHISKMAKERVEKVEDVMNIGDKVKVKVTEIDSQNRINLSRKELL